MVCCVAVGCSTRPGKGIPMHRFPRDQERQRVWITKIRRENWQPSYNSSYLCDLHFDSSQYEKHREDGVRKLKPNAIPVLFNYLSEGKSAKLQNPRPSPKKRSSSAPIGDREAKRDRPNSDLQEMNEPSASIETLLDASLEHQLESEMNESSTSIATSLDANSIDQVESEIDLTSTATPSNPMSIDQVELLNARIEYLQRQLKTEKNLTSKLKTHAQMQNDRLKSLFNEDQMDKLGRQTTRGCKWSDESVKKGLQLRFSCGKTGYEMLLAENYPYPSIRSLNRRMEHISLEPGIANEVFDFLKLKVNNMGPHEKDCELTLDEMSIQPGVQYDRSTSCIRGEITLPDHSGYATHALVFMLSGVSTRWKQTVGYHFTGDSVNGDVIKPIINEIIRLSANIGLHIVCITSDMGASNRAMQRAFGISCTKSSQQTCASIIKIIHPTVPDRHLHFMCDVPHLIKNLKHSLFNNLITLDASIVKKFNLPTATVSLAPIKSLLEFQNDHDLKLTPKLTSLTTDRFGKMKVSSALNLFSKSTSSGLRYLVQNEGYSQDLLTTAWFLEFINHWFDLMSSRHPVMALSRANPEAYRKAVDHLQTTIILFETITIGKQWKPVQTGIIMSTLSMLDIQQELLDKGFGFILTSRFTQDCLENLYMALD